MSLELIPARKHGVWGWPAAINFIFGSTAAGFYLVKFFFETFYGIGFDEHLRAMSELIAPTLVVIGFSVLTFEAGRPLRLLYLLGNLQRSWMSREVLAGLILVSASVTDFLHPNFYLKVSSAAAAAGLLVSQGFIMYQAVAVTAWRVLSAPVLFASSGLMKGYGTWLILVAIGGWSVGIEPLLIGVSLSGVNVFVWSVYLHRRRDSSFHRATEPLRRHVASGLTVYIGHVAPFILLLLLVFDVDVTSEMRYFLVPGAGALIVAGGIVQKAGMIMKTNYFRSVVLGARDQATDEACSLAFTSTSQRLQAGALKKN